ncbi:hypothetical protein BS50DRAFT_142341 [Corynespora cassiicola Philippines]|uniref:Uncharacterized protein n=1 Tax=Corynespora cassiicola Philippines TaxID=1448308 RepID=A0A2T2NAB6_CORCC|nr:hypothetical protein BS50DRAFT_142341 [Corynespora cassiicola Philippines]
MRAPPITGGGFQREIPGPRARMERGGAYYAQTRRSGRALGVDAMDGGEKDASQGATEEWLWVKKRPDRASAVCSVTKHRMRVGVEFGVALTWLGRASLWWRLLIGLLGPSALSAQPRGNPSAPKHQSNVRCATTVISHFAAPRALSLLHSRFPLSTSGSHPPSHFSRHPRRAYPPICPTCAPSSHHLPRARGRQD